MSAKKILIIDDDEHLLVGLSAKLKANGYSVVSAMDGVAAVAMTRTESPDLIVLDLGLPAGDGFVFLERLRSLAPHIATPVIVLSARDPSGNKQRAMQAGAAAFLQKPPDNRELLSEIGRALGERGAMSQFLKT